jgi:hypothetical protein
MDRVQSHATAMHTGSVYDTCIIVHSLGLVWVELMNSSAVATVESQRHLK